MEIVRYYTYTGRDGKGTRFVWSFSYSYYSMQTFFFSNFEEHTVQRYKFNMKAKKILLFHLNFKIFYIKVKNYYYLVMFLKAFQ